VKPSVRFRREALVLDKYAFRRLPGPCARSRSSTTCILEAPYCCAWCCPARRAPFLMCDANAPQEARAGAQRDFAGRGCRLAARSSYILYRAALSRARLWLSRSQSTPLRNLPQRASPLAGYTATPPPHSSSASTRRRRMCPVYRTLRPPSNWIGHLDDGWRVAGGGTAADESISEFLSPAGRRCNHGVAMGGQGVAECSAVSEPERCHRPLRQLHCRALVHGTVHGTGRRCRGCLASLLVAPFPRNERSLRRALHSVSIR